MNTQSFHYPTVTFSGLKKVETAKHNEYSTQCLKQEAWDKEVISEKSAAATK